MSRLDRVPNIAPSGSLNLFPDGAACQVPPAIRDGRAWLAEQLVPGDWALLLYRALL
jgi:hypothetical protein